MRAGVKYIRKKGFQAPGGMEVYVFSRYKK